MFATAGSFRADEVVGTGGDVAVPVDSWHVDDGAAALAVHLERFGAGPDGLVFTSSTGAPLRRSTWGKGYKVAADAVGVDSSTHDLRHHCASVLISSGVSIKSVQRFLGHKNAALRGNVRGVCADGVEQGAI
jgi:integrase